MLDRRAAAGLTVHPDKIQLCVQEFKFLGHVLSPGLLRPDPDKVAAVERYPNPVNVKQVIIIIIILVLTGSIHYQVC